MDVNLLVYFILGVVTGVVFSISLIVAAFLLAGSIDRRSK